MAGSPDWIRTLVNSFCAPKQIPLIVFTSTPSKQLVRQGELLTFGEWAGFFLENYSKPPIRAAGTHEAFWFKQAATGDDGRMQPFVPVEVLFKGRHFDGQIIILCVT